MWSTNASVQRLQEAGDAMKKLLTWGAIAFVIFYLVTQPTSAAGVIHGAWHGLGTAGHALATFVNSLVA